MGKNTARPARAVRKPNTATKREVVPGLASGRWFNGEKIDAATNTWLEEEHAKVKAKEDKQ